MNRHNPRAWVLLLTAILIIAGCGDSPMQPAPQSDSATDSSPAEGVRGEDGPIDMAVLQALDQEFADGKHGYIDGMLVLHDGEVVYERRYEQDYATPYQDYVAAGTRDGYWGEGQYHYLDPQWHPWLEGGDLHTLQSVTKSVAATLIGIAIHQGAIESVDVEVAQYFDHPHPFQGDPRADGLTLRELLTMSAGVDWNEADYSQGTNNCIIMERSEDWVQYVLDQGMVEQPGTVFNYNSGLSVLLDHILWKATGMHADEYGRKHLFGPVGIDDFYWKTTPTGIIDTEGGLYLSPRSLARIGELYAGDGVWDGQRIFGESWDEESFAPAISVDRGNGWMYGYQWWLMADPARPDHFIPSARGYGGQYLLIMKEDGLIAVFNGWNIHPGTTLLSLAYAVEQLQRAVR